MSIRPIKTDSYVQNCTFTRTYTNGTSTTTNTSGTATIVEDHPIAGADGNFVNTTPYAVNLRRLDYPSGFVAGVKNNGWKETYSGNLNARAFPKPSGFGIFPPTSSLDSLESAAIIAALNDMKSQAANLLVFYAERLEAGALVVGVVKKAVSLLRKFRRSLIRRALKLVRRSDSEHSKEQWFSLYSKSWSKVKRRFSSWYDMFKSMTLEGLIQRLGKWATARWLEFTFGWRPLIGEAASIIDAVRNPKIQDVEIVKTRSTRVMYNPPQPFDFAIGLKGTWRGFCTHRQSVRVKLHARIQFPALAAASELGLTNPHLMIWELIPFSWVVDAFLPIGGWLQSLDADFGWTILGSSSVSRKSTKKGKYTFIGLNPTVSWTQASGSGSCGEEITLFERKGLVTLADFPSLQLSGGITLVQVFSNVMSILVQMINGDGLPKGARV